MEVNYLRQYYEEIQKGNIIVGLELKTELQNAKAEIAYLKSIAPVVTAEDGFYVVDANDYIGFKVDNNGATDSATTIETTNLDE